QGAHDAAIGALVGADGEAGTGTSAMTAEGLARQLPRMNALVERRRALELEVRLSAAKLGEAHPTIKELKNQISVYSEEIDELIAAYNDGLQGGEGSAEILARAGGGASLLDQLVAEE